MTQPASNLVVPAALAAGGGDDMTDQGSASLLGAPDAAAPVPLLSPWDAVMRGWLTTIAVIMPSTAFDVNPYAFYTQLSQSNQLVLRAAVDCLVEMSSTAVMESALVDAKHMLNPFRATLDPLRAEALFLSYTRKHAVRHMVGALPKLPKVGVLDASVTNTL
jgi:hypothetical protein